MAKATKIKKVEPEVVEVKEVVVKDATEIVKEIVVEESNYKPSEYVVKEIMIQKNVSFDEAFAILKSTHK